MAIPTSAASIALNRRKTLAAKSAPSANEIRLCRSVMRASRAMNRIQPNKMMVPMIPRSVETVSASPPARNATLLSTSAQASEEAARRAGPTGASRLTRFAANDRGTVARLATGCGGA
jgi:hypothetical protein